MRLASAGVCGAVMAAVVLGCMAEVVRSPTAFTRAEGDQPVLKLARPLALQVPSGLTRTLEPGSTWRRVGAVPQGDVYRPVGFNFTVVGGNAHEAYLVVKDQQVVGFYLPADQCFSPVSSPAPLAPVLEGT